MLLLGWFTSSFFSRSSILCSSLYILLSRSDVFASTSLLLYPFDSDENVCGCADAGLELSINPKKFAFDCVSDGALSVRGSSLVGAISTKPSEVVGMSMFLFGILTTPRFWSSRMSTMSFLLLGNIIWLG